MFDNVAQFDLFKAALQRDAQLHENATRILQNSSTARRTAGRESFEQEPGVGETMIAAATGGAGQALTNFAMRAIRAAKITEEKAAKVAELLMSSDPHEVAAAVQILEDQASKASTRKALTTAAEVGSVGGVTSMAPMAPRPEEAEMDIEGAPTDLQDIAGPDIESDIAADIESETKKKKTPGSSMIR